MSLEIIKEDTVKEQRSEFLKLNTVKSKSSLLRHFKYSSSCIYSCDQG